MFNMKLCFILCLPSHIVMAVCANGNKKMDSKVFMGFEICVLALDIFHVCLNTGCLDVRR